MNLKEIHQSCSETILRELFESEDGYGRSNACQVYDALVGQQYGCEDCIGENFNHLLQNLVSEWFENYKPGSSVSYYFQTYILLLYLFVERVDLVFEVINSGGRSKIISDFHYKNFPILRRINKWANFFKHPKEFLFTHWPNYVNEGEDHQLGQDDVLINYEFIKDHYFSDKKPAPKVLENNDRVFVEVPNLVNLTSGFCDEMNTFFRFICCNDLVADFLKKKSTIRQSFDETYEADLSEDSNPLP